MKIEVKAAAAEAVEQIKKEAVSRAYRAANALRNAELEVLRGTRSGRVYRIPFSSSTYRASAPGEPPAVRSGRLRQSWRALVDSEKNGKNLRIKPAINTDVIYAPILEKGTGHMAPRPFEEPIVERAKDEIVKIYKEPY